MAGYALPQFQYPGNATLDFSPITQGLNVLGKTWEHNRKTDNFKNALAQAQGVVDPRLMALAEAQGYEQGPNALMQAYAQEQQRKMQAASQAEAVRQHNSTIALQQQQLNLAKQAEARNAALTPYDIAVRKAQADSANVDSELMRNLMPQAGAPTPPPMQAQPEAAPPNALAPRSPLPGPSLQPQSGDGFDPSMVRPIADAPSVPQSAPAPQQAAPRMVETPFGTMPLDRARQMAGVLALRGKNEAAKMMQHAVESASLGKAGQTEVDKKAVDSGELATRLDSIMAKFKPEYQQLGTQLKMSGANWADWLGMGDKIPPAARQQMAEYQAFRQDSFNNLSQYIKEVTGAAMGVQEEKRIRMGMPDPEKDGPTQFEAKLRNSIAQTKFALARYNYLAKQGYSVEALATNREKLSGMVGLDQMPKIINQRGAALRQQISASQPGMPAGDIDAFVVRQLKQEFGI